MNILVYNVAAEYAGAMTILKEFYSEVVSCHDQTHRWYFVVSAHVLEERENIKIIRVPWVKKSWLHRWFYDVFHAKKLIEQYDIDLVFSMQNMPITGARCKQLVYLHQSLQFSPIKYSFWKKEERTYWIRQNVICNLMKKSLAYADAIIVQTEWMKEATKGWLKNFDKDIKVLPPNVNKNTYNRRSIQRQPDLFIYPAADGIYKNHKLILEACKILKEENVPYRVLFTMKPNESSLAIKLYSEVIDKGLNIEFTGLLSREQVMELYETATLLFPSYLETFGLPLLEARDCNDLILCSDMPFAHEILDGYENAYFFAIDDAKQLAEYMTRCSSNSLRPNKTQNTEQKDHLENRQTLISTILEMK